MRTMLLAAALCLAVLGSAPCAAQAADPEYELSFNLPIPPNHTRYEKVLKGWCAEVEKRSQGRLRIVPYFSEALSRQSEAFESVKNGVADLTETTFNSGNGQFPAHEAMFTALLPSRALANPTAFINALREQFPKMQEELAGTKLLFVHAHPVALMIGTKTPVTSLADLKGRKISMLGRAVVSEKLRALGVSPIQLQTSEEFMAIQQGVVDGNMIEFDQLVSRRYGELLKCMTLVNLGSTAFFCVMNQDVYDGLPEDLQAVIDSVSGEYAEKLMADYWNTQEFESLKVWLDTMGGQLYMLTDEEYAAADRAVEPALQTWLDDVNAAGYDGQKLLDTIKALEAQYNPLWKDYTTAQYLKR